MNKKLAAVLTAGALALGLTGCVSQSDRASENLSKDAEEFKVNRRVVFFNGITDKYLLTVEGRCSVESSDSALGGSLEVTCKIGEDAYKKHFLGLSDNVSYFVEQMEAVDVSVYHYQVIFKPEAIMPDLQVSTGKQ
jgi:hypothetical protein